MLDETSRMVLWLSAAAFAGIGLPFLWVRQTMASFVDLSLGSATAGGDVRADCGSANLGVAIFLALAVKRRAWAEPARCLVVLTFGGQAVARPVSCIWVGLPSTLGFALLAAETVGAVAGLLAIRQMRTVS